MGCVDIKPNWRVSFDPLHVFTSPHPTAQSYITPSGFGTAVDVEKNKIAQVKLHLKNPYMNPGDLQDLDWWKEAMPEKNMIVWGGKEIMADDIASFARMLEEVRLKRPSFLSSFLSLLFSLGWDPYQAPQERTVGGKAAYIWLFLVRWPLFDTARLDTLRAEYSLA